ncbi:MAG: hypothetical protein M3280_11415 [Actinomycetota bacterium]|nr:hypothetical protein [Actinomycetota bacterium]
MVRRALRALEESGIDFSIRKGPRHDDELPLGGEIDLAVPRTQLRSTEGALATAGFKRLKARGHPGHRFFVRAERGRWIKIDVKVDFTPAFGGGIGRFLSAFGRRLPLSFRRVGSIVAILGPDGAGKGAVVAALVERIPIGVDVVYLGSRRAQSHPDAGAASERPLPKAAREALWMFVRLLRTWGKLGGIYARAWRGHVVLCDRHPIEVLAIRPRRRLPGFERFLVRRLVPNPDAVVILDAPGEVLFERKREHTSETLETWRRRYLEEFGDTAEVISSAGPIEDTVAEVSQRVWHEVASRRRW